MILTLCAGERSPETEALRRSVQQGCEQQIWEFFNEGGQVAIYDANNGTREARNKLAEKFDKEGVHVIMLGAVITHLLETRKMLSRCDRICV